MRVVVIIALIIFTFTGCVPGQEGAKDELLSSGASTGRWFSEGEKDTRSSESIETSEDEDSDTEFPLILENNLEYQEEAYVVINDNHPFFVKEQYKILPYKQFSELDELGRCGPAFAIVCKETMPTEERGSIGNIRPSGWHTLKYNGLIEGNYLYNRCHLIAYQLSGENGNEQNLITGTRYFNTEGMLPFEREVIEYIENSDNHVMYRVTPVFEGSNLLASGVLMEAESVEDNGEGICFNVFVYNVQPGISIDYETGESFVDPDYEETQRNIPVKEETNNLEIEDDKTGDREEQKEEKYILNINTLKFHRPTCESINDIKEKNKEISDLDRDEIIEQGYTPCKRCNP